MPRRLKELHAQGKVTRVLGIGQLFDPKLVEMVGMSGFWDGVWLDQEHVGLSVSDMEHGARAARVSGIDCFVRVAPTDYATVMRPYEAGALGVMAAQIRSFEQAEQVVRWTKFHPLGDRGVNSAGVDGGFASMPLADYMKKANDETYIILQVEHFDAVKVVEKIAAIKNLDGLFIGPADLTQSMGITAQWDHPDLWSAIERVAKAASKNNVPWSILPSSPAVAKRCLELGCRMLSIGIDTWLIQRGLKSFQSEYESILG